jgi:hypothetical protein
VSKTSEFLLNFQDFISFNSCDFNKYTIRVIKAASAATKMKTSENEDEDAELIKADKSLYSSSDVEMSEDDTSEE